MLHRVIVIGTALLAVAGVAHAQVASSERQRIVGRTLTCQDRCNNELKQCLAPPGGHGPLSPINPNDPGTINTPQSYDECI